VTGKPSESGSERTSRVEQLIREGIAATKSGDKATARARLREAVALDESSEKAWFWLASVVESDEERRVCLGNVLVINPNNTRAQEMLDRLTMGPRGSPGGRGGLPPLDPGMRRTITLMGGVILVMLLIVLVVFQGGGDASSPTQAAAAATTVAPTSTLDMIAPTLTVEALATAAQSTLNARRTEIASTPAWTATPSPTPAGTMTGTPLPMPPPGLPGRLVIIQGNERIRGLVLNFRMIDMSTLESRDLLGSGTRGDYGVLLPDGRRIVYGQHFPGTGQMSLRIANLNGAQVEDVGAMWGNNPSLRDQQMVTVARDGSGLAFSAQNVVQNDLYPNIYYLPVSFPTSTEPPTPTPTPTETPTEPPTPTPDADGEAQPTPTQKPSLTLTETPEPVQVVRLTDRNTGIYTWPDLSPDGRTIVFVGDRTPIDESGADIYTVPVTGGPLTNLTGDGPAIAESAPRWSPDGAQIVYAGIPRGETLSNLYLMNADGSNRRPLLVGGDNIRPHWSPDGRYIAFSSRRTGTWEVFILELATEAVYQITNTAETAICTDWGR
jgi:hypothetical protein